MGSCQHAVENFFQKWGKVSPYALACSSCPQVIRLLWSGIAKRRRRAYGGSILRAGCKSPPAVMAVFRTSPRAPHHATWCGSADPGEIPEPTVTVRMKENGSFFCRVGRKEGRSCRPPRSAHGSRALMHIFRPVRADQGDDDASVPRYPGFFW